MAIDYDTATRRLGTARPPSARAVLAGYGLAVARESASARAVLVEYGLLPTWMAPTAEEPAMPAPAPVAPVADVPPAAATPPEAPRPAVALVRRRPRPRRFGLLARLAVTIECRRARWARWRADGGDRNRRTVWGAM